MTCLTRMSLIYPALNRAAISRPVLPVELSVNNDFVSSSEITFTELKNKEGEPYLFPCFSAETIIGFGVNIARPEELTEQDKQCFPFTEKIPGSEYHFDFQKQRLMLSFPQASLSGRPAAIFRRTDGNPVFRHCL